MATSPHVLIKTDASIKAFFKVAAITNLGADRIFPQKSSSEKTLPCLIISTDSATRKRSRNWEVSGSIILKTDCTDSNNADAIAASSEMESAVLNALEAIVPDDDRPQLDKFKEVARENGADESEAHWDGRLNKVVKAKPAPETQRGG